jgi:hypothetical protein
MAALLMFAAKFWDADALASMSVLSKKASQRLKCSDYYESGGMTKIDIRPFVLPPR